MQDDFFRSYDRAPHMDRDDADKQVRATVPRHGARRDNRPLPDV